MRALLSFLIGIIVAAVVVSLGVLVAQNGQTVPLTILGMSVQTQTGWLVAGAAGLGFVLAVLLLIPGQMARAWRGWWLGRQLATLEQRFAALSEQQAMLQGAHQRLLAEHHQVLAHVLPPLDALPGAAPGVPERETAAGAAPAAADARPALVASPLPPGTLGAPTPEQFAAEPLPRTGPILPPAAPTLTPTPSLSGEATPESSAPAAANGTPSDTPGGPSSTDISISPNSTDTSSHEPG
jgi:Lipopolysaccharide assembly protein A domain